MLKSIKSSPKIIYAIGDISILNKKSISIVGSRNNSEYGRNVTKIFTKELVKNDMVIVSGLARGIDSIAHEACINNFGKTIAVVGSGLKNIYPPENEYLFYKIIENGGLIISEYPMDYPVQLKNFPKRNRIISGLSLGTLIIEATYRSGTSITARFAKAQGRKVFCIPNCIGNKNSCGIINMIREGAIVVRNGQDIMNELGMEVISMEKKKKNKQLKILDEDSKKIFNCIYEDEGINIEKIVINTGLDISVVNEKISMLEIDGIIESIGMNRFKVDDCYYE